MNYFKAFIAVLKGLNFCFTRPSIRRLAVWPWILGTICYLISIAGAFKLHPVILHRMLGDPSGFLRTVLFYIAALFLAFLLFVAAGLLSAIVVTILASVFQTSIAFHTLQELGREVPQEPQGVSGNLQEIARTVLVELIKLLWIVPFMFVLLLAGLIPLLAPAALVLGSWLLAYQFIDTVLDIYKLGAWQRLKFSLNNFLTVCCFGLALTLCWAIPFLGMLIIPAAASGAAWLLHETNLLPGEKKAVIAPL